MQLAHTLTFRFDRVRSRPARSRSRAAAVPAARRRRSDAPQDHAFYTCSCGYAFTAQVSTSVGCPHCGTSQAW